VIEPSPPKGRELHECCCVEFSPNDNGVPCGALVDADSPFCPNCEEHRSKPHMMGEGWGFSQRLTTSERK